MLNLHSSLHLCVQTESKKTNDDDYDEYEDDFEVRYRISFCFVTELP